MKSRCVVIQLCNIVYYDRHPSCHRHVVVLLSISSSSVETKIRSTASSFLILSTELYLLIIFHPMKFGTDGAVLCCLVQLSILTNYHTRRMYALWGERERSQSTTHLSVGQPVGGTRVCGVRRVLRSRIDRRTRVIAYLLGL